MNRAETLQRLAQLCRNRRDAAPATESSGCATLDAVLPGGGWQVGTIIELMPAETGIGELRVLMPALARLTRADRHVALVAPPYIPYAPAFVQHGVCMDRLLVIHARQPNDILWAFEQTLRCTSFGAVLAWPSSVRDREVRRLQLAAEAGQTLGFMYRTPAAALEASPAAVRLKLRAGADGALNIDILKCRGGRSGISVRAPARS
jgi:protein ImuA